MLELKLGMLFQKYLFDALNNYVNAEQLSEIIQKLYNYSIIVN